MSAIDLLSAIDLSRYFANREAGDIGTVFASRRAVVPWRGGQPVGDGDMPDIWAELMTTAGAPEERLVYVHIPFCANHCLFCGFYRNAYAADAGAAYADQLVAEIEREAAAPRIRHSRIAAVYLGGGTPSALSAAELTRILTALRQNLPLAPDCEITLEARIIHFDGDKIDACLAAGVNRISVGVQSFDTAVRRRQGRRADRDEAIRCLAAIRDRHQAALVIDLLYGLPGQSLEIWREDLRIAADLAPDGVDLYGLNLIPGTPLHHAVTAGKMERPTLQALAAMYEMGADYLGERGWRQLSNSHWARTPAERNLYNLRIKQGVDCLAYGSGAGGSLGRYSYSVAGDLERYGAALAAGRKPLGGMSLSEGPAAARHYVTAGFEVGRLELGGLPQADRVTDLVAPLLDQWQSAGLLVRTGDTVDLTTAGRFWYGNLIAAFNDVIAAAASPGS